MNIIPHITDYTELRGKRVLLRLDLNVPLEGSEIRDDFRIKKAIPTIAYLRDAGARTVIISHIGSGKKEDSLHPVAEYLQKKFPVTFLNQLENAENKEIVGRMQEGDVVMLENLRHSKGEEGNDEGFSSYLASLGDIYVNDAFSVSHRAHASVVGVAKLLPHYAGLQMAEEVTRLAQAFEPVRPFLFVLGGAKISTKMTLLKKFLTNADHVFVGGAIVNNLLKAKGLEIGVSLFDASELADLAPVLASDRLILPIDVVIKNESGSMVRPVSGVTSGDAIVDIGPETIRNLQGVIRDAKLIVWNGPLGFYEEGFVDGTRELLERISASHATSIIGGGDTVALINEMGTIDKFSFVSTGGGAMLDYLSSETLPGIEALEAPNVI